DVLRPVTIVRTEIASGKKRHMQCREISRLDDVPNRRLRRASVNGQSAESDSLESSRKNDRDGCRLDIRQAANAIHDVMQKPRRSELRVSGSLHVERCEFDTLRIETGIDRHHMLQRSYEQPGGDDQKDAQRNLDDNEGVAETQSTEHSPRL